MGEREYFENLATKELGEGYVTREATRYFR